MATQTKLLLSYPDLTISFEWDDVNLRITRIIVNNTGTNTYTVSATALANNKNYTFTITPGTNISQVISTNAANRLGISVTPSGKLDGVEWSVS